MKKRLINITKKWHKDCGGIVKYQKPMFKTFFEQAGLCLKCDVFPLYEEEIIFEIDIKKAERFYGEKCGWLVVPKSELPETLEVE